LGSMVCNSHDGRRDEGEPRSVVSNADYEGIAWGIGKVHRNIFAYSDRGGFSLSFGYVYVKFEPRPKKLLAVKDENLGLILCLVRGHHGMAFDSAVLVSSMR